MRSLHPKAVALNLPQDLAIEVPRYADRAAAVQQVADSSHTNLVLRVSSRDLSHVESAAITVTK